MVDQNITKLPWRCEAIDFSRIDRSQVADNEDLFFLLCVSSFIESGSDIYTSNLATFFDGDDEVTDWLTAHWEPEELQHGRALKAYIQAVWPDFDWDSAFSRFFAEYGATCTIEEFEKTRALEMAARCVVETGTASLYRAINTYTNEPVLQELTNHIRSDEVRHYKYFLRFFKRYNASERHGRLTTLRTLARRVREIKNDDSEISLRHVFMSRYPQASLQDERLPLLTRRINHLVRRNASASMAVKMLLKPLALSPRVQPGIEYLLTKATRYLFLR